MVRFKAVLLTVQGSTPAFSNIHLLLAYLIAFKHHDINMVLAKAVNQHVLKGFDLSGKVAAVTGRFIDNHSPT